MYPAGYYPDPYAYAAYAPQQYDPYERGYPRVRSNDRASHDESHHYRRDRSPSQPRHRDLSRGELRDEERDRYDRVNESYRRSAEDRQIPSSRSQRPLNERELNEIARELQDALLTHNRDKAFRVFDRMRGDGLRINPRHYTTFINTCAHHGDCDLADFYYQEMIRDGLEPNVYTFTSLIKVCTQAGDIKRAFHYWREMGRRKVSPTLLTYTCLTALCGNCQALPSLRDVIEHVRLSGFSLDDKYRETLSIALLQCVRIEEAYQILGNDASHGKFLRFFIEGQDLEGAFTVLKKVGSDLSKLDKRLFLELLDLSVRKGTGDEILFVLNKMEIPPDPSQIDRAVQSVVKSNFDQADKIVQKARDMKVFILGNTWKTLAEHCRTRKDKDYFHQKEREAWDQGGIGRR